MGCLCGKAPPPRSLSLGCTASWYVTYIRPSLDSNLPVVGVPAKCLHTISVWARSLGVLLLSSPLSHPIPLAQPSLVSPVLPPPPPPLLFVARGRKGGPEEPARATGGPHHGLGLRRRSLRKARPRPPRGRHHRGVRRRMAQCVRRYSCVWACLTRWGM